MVSSTPQRTDFSLDVLGRYVCNGFDEALASMDSSRGDTRPFDTVVIGGGSFGPVVAQHLFHANKTARILVLEAGPFSLAEHVQNHPMLGLTPPPPTSIAQLRNTGQGGQPRNEVWGLPWHSPTRFPGLAYTLGGRSVFFGGWSPPLLDAEMPLDAWPQSLVDDLTGRYFPEAARQIGTDTTNDFIYGELHSALRGAVFQALDDEQVRHTVPLGELPDHPAMVDSPTVPQLRDMLGLSSGDGHNRQALLELLKLEAPLAVQTRTRPGFFPFNKFSALPLLVRAAREAWAESGNDDARKRLMVVPNCHVTRLAADDGRVTEVHTNRGTLPVAPGSAVVLAASTIENARLAQVSFPDNPLAGRNLTAHLRSNLTIRIPRAALGKLTAEELQASALFVKGRRAVGGIVRHFHLQVTAAGLGEFGTDSEAELFKKIPDVDTFDRFRSATDTHVAITIRGIAEMEAQNPANAVGLDSEPDEYGVPRAFVTLAPSADDKLLWQAMDEATDDLAQSLAGGERYEVLTSDGLVELEPDTAPAAVVAFEDRHDTMGTTHHETGTLWMGEDPATSVTDTNARFHDVSNAYVAGPALLPTIGSPNPMLSGVALARRLGDHLATRPVGQEGFEKLFDGRMHNWRMVGAGTVRPDDDGLQMVSDGGPGLCWCTTPLPRNFLLRLEWQRSRDEDNSGVFVRFPHPARKGYDNPAYVPVHFGFEVQIDELGSPAGAPEHKTGAIYGEADADLSIKPANAPGQWNLFEIQVEGQTYTVFLNGDQVCRYTNPREDRGLPTTGDAASYMGLQAHTGLVTFRNIQIKAL